MEPEQYLDIHYCLTCKRREIFDDREDPPLPNADCEKNHVGNPDCVWVCGLVPIP